MFFKKKFDDTRYDTLISAKDVIEGAISYSGTLRIDGVFKGVISKNATGKELFAVIVNGTCEANIDADFITINGELTGDVNTPKLKITNKGVLTGNATYDEHIEVQVGAVVNGMIQKKRPSIPILNQET